jgi:hypothetical protein
MNGILRVDTQSLQTRHLAFWQMHQIQQRRKDYVLLKPIDKAFKTILRDG